MTQLSYIYAPGDIERKGKFIVFEGIDSVGKKTQAELLKSRMERCNIKVKLISFPRYDTIFGALVGKYLRGEFGSIHKIPPEIPVILYAMDRYQFRDNIKSDLDAGIYYISDRYTQSNLGYHAAKYEAKETRDKFIEWIEALESRLPQPDIVILLHMPSATARKLIVSRGAKAYLEGSTQDVHEEDIEYQERVMATYIELANSRPNWTIIHCVKNNVLRPIEAIHEDIVKVISDKLALRL
jgi:dTMP kinase